MLAEAWRAALRPVLPLPAVLAALGSADAPVPGVFFTGWHACQYGLEDPQNHLPMLKHVSAAATYKEIAELELWEGDQESHSQHQRVRGQFLVARISCIRPEDGTLLVAQTRLHHGLLLITAQW